MNSKFFVIWGMHRGGTSLLAAAMQVFGARPQGTLLPADYNNPRGYFETLELINLNEAMFSELGQRWYGLGYIGSEQVEMLVRAGHLERAVEYLRKQAEHPAPVLLKDPRMSRLGALWNRAFAQLDITPYSIVVWRDPMAVSASLCRRALKLKIPTPLVDERYGWLLWLSYMRSSLIYTQFWPRVLIGYENFVEHPAECLLEMGRLLDTGVDMAVLNDFCGHFVDPGLNHHGPAEADSIMPAKVRAMYELLSSRDSLECPDISPQAWEPDSEEKLLAALLDDANRKIRENALKMATIHSEICILTGECKRMALELARR